jgi:beta-glucosidase
MRTPAMDRLEGNGVKVEHIDCTFADDVVVTKVDKYFKLSADKETLVEVDVDTSNGTDFTFGIDSDDPGRYEVIFTARSDLNSLAQIPMTIYCSSIPFNVITWNGLEGQTGTQESEFIMLSRYNVFRLHFGAPGVKLISIKIKLKVRAEDDPFFKGE